MYAATGGSRGGDIHGAIKDVAGVQFTIVTAVIVLAAFILKGSMAFNSKDLYGEGLDIGSEDKGNAESAESENDSELKRRLLGRKGRASGWSLLEKSDRMAGTNDKGDGAC